MDAWQYIVLLGAVIAVFAIISPKRPANAAVSNNGMQNMETALEQFMENMERDNEELVGLVKDYQQSASQDSNKYKERISALEYRCEKLEEQLKFALERLEYADQAYATIAASQASRLSAETAATFATQLEREVSAVAEPNPPRDTIEARYGELFELYRGGKSIEAIAKKLGMNKGEVSLIIGLAKQEGDANG